MSLVLLQSGAAPGAGNSATPFVLDLAGNGIDLGGQTTTALFGTVKTLRWTKAASDDSFLAADATEMRQRGFNWKSEAGVSLAGNQLVRGGTRLRGPEGKEVVITDSWHFLAQLDTNKDGKLNAADPVWADLKLFGDANADGKLEADELMSLANSGVASVSLSHAAPIKDSFGNELSNGTYQTGSGQTRTASGVALARVVTQPAKAP